MALDPESIAIVQAGALETGPYVAGALEARRSASLRAELAAQVVATYAEEGDAVAEGTVLVELEAAELRNAVLSAERSVATSEQAVANARRNVERAERLYAVGGVALRDVEDARLNLAMAEAQLAEAERVLARAEEQLGDTEVRAPFGGRVARRHVSAGDVVQPGADLYTVIDPTTMRLEAEIPAEHLGAARIGAPVRFEVRGYPGRVFQGTVSAIAAAADSTTRQIRVVVTIPNPGGELIADLFADGRIVAASRPGLIIPEDAVDETGAGPVVTAVRQGRAVRVEITIELRDDWTGQLLVSGALAPGDTVLVGAARTITEGTPVVVRPGS